MQFATIKGLRIEKYTLQSQNWRESAKTNKTSLLADLLPPAATLGKKRLYKKTLQRLYKKTLQKLYKKTLYN
jgi:hypothetical protein